LSKTLVFFPDPWSRKKSWLKRRLVQRWFLNNLYDITKFWWKFIFKTDHLGYFLHVLQEIGYTNWSIKFKTFDYEKEGLYDSNAITEFEQIFRWQNIKVCYLELIKK
jgi:tRNA G46 methylase TrmB